MNDEVEKKLSAACSTLIIDKPFLGALVLRMPMLPADKGWCKTTGTDARAIYYNPDYINELSFEQTQFVVAHEALHCALSHFARREHRVKHRWDLACDLAINPILINDGLTPPPDALYLEQFANMSAEEIYPMLDDFENMQTQDDHLYDQEEPLDTPPPQNQDQSNADNNQNEAELDPNRGGAPQPKPLSKEERDQLSVQWQQRMAGAAQQAMQSGKLSGDMARLVDHLLQPRLPWRMLLSKYMTAAAREDYNYTRPSRREGSAILPSLRSNQIDLVVVIDTSGSISHDEMQEFVSEVDSIKGQVRARITLHACDNQLNQDGPWEFEFWDEFKLPESLGGGGGTDFSPVFTWLDQNARRPDLLVYFTDAEGVFPKLEASFPVIWLVKGKSKVPWGQRIQLN
jgi:predicted metal-dependent peptidase